MNTSAKIGGLLAAVMLAASGIPPIIKYAFSFSLN